MGLPVKQSPAAHFPAAEAPGSVRWNQDDLEWQYWDGASWTSAGGGGVTDHGALTGLGDDDHTQYQLRSEQGSPSGYPALNPSSKVVEDPANATTTPTASKIPIADGSGTLNAWVTTAPPVGSILMWAGHSLLVPSGWLLCDGTAIDPSVYTSLAPVITTTFNTGGEPPGWIRVPDLRSRFPYGAATDLDRGSLGGSSTHTHSNAMSLTSVTVTVTAAPTKAPGVQPAGLPGAAVVTDPGHTHAMGVASSLPPYIGLHFIIRAT